VLRGSSGSDQSRPSCSVIFILGSEHDGADRRRSREERAGRDRGRNRHRRGGSREGGEEEEEEVMRSAPEPGVRGLQEEVCSDSWPSCFVLPVAVFQQDQADPGSAVLLQGHDGLLLRAHGMGLWRLLFFRRSLHFC